MALAWLLTAGPANACTRCLKVFADGTPVAGRPNLSIGGWAQYALDSYATVAEAVADLEKQPFTIIAPVLPNGEAGVGHLAISDQSGDSAIFEFLGGQLKIHHDRHYTVMTNSPPGRGLRVSQGDGQVTRRWCDR